MWVQDPETGEWYDNGEPDDNALADLYSQQFEGADLGTDVAAGGEDITTWLGANGGASFIEEPAPRNIYDLYAAGLEETRGQNVFNRDLQTGSQRIQQQNADTTKAQLQWLMEQGRLNAEHQKAALAQQDRQFYDNLKLQEKAINAEIEDAQGRLALTSQNQFANQTGWFQPLPGQAPPGRSAVGDMLQRTSAPFPQGYTPAPQTQNPLAAAFGGLGGR